jgi:flagellar biosynthesis/type III secretory pathway chaperone
MISNKEIYNHLNSLLKLLQEEKEALIHNDVLKVAELVEKKSELIEKISQLEVIPSTVEASSNVVQPKAEESSNAIQSKVGESPHVIPTAVEESPLLKIINDINSIQEINLLLTKQSLSYQNVLLESISKNIQNMSNTYSAKGNYQKANNTYLYDQEV